MIAEDIIKLLACPLTHDPLRLEGDTLVNVKWGIKYPIRNGIPVMLIEQARFPDGVETLEEMKRRIREAQSESVIISENPT